MDIPRDNVKDRWFSKGKRIQGFEWQDSAGFLKFDQPKVAPIYTNILTGTDTFGVGNGGGGGGVGGSGAAAARRRVQPQQL